MNKKIKNLGYVLNFAAIIILIAVLGIVLTSNLSYEIKALLIVIYSATQFIFYVIVKKFLKIDMSSKWFYSVGFFSSLVALIVFYKSNYLLELFNNSGFIYIYLAMVFMYIGIFFIISSKIFKNYKLLKITYLSAFLMVCSLLIYYKIDIFYILLLLSVISLIINVMFYNKSIGSVSKLFGYILPCILIVVGSSNAVRLLILTIINTLNIFSIMYRNKDLESSLLSILVLFGNYFIFDSSLINNFELKYSVPIIISFNLMLGLLIEYIGLVKKKGLIATYKIIIYISSIFIILWILKDLRITSLIASSLLLISLITNKVIFKDDKFNKYIIPIGVFIELITVVNLIAFYFNISNSISLFIINIFLLVLYKFSSLKELKIVYSILTGLILASLVLISSTTIISYISTLGVLLLDYLFIVKLDKSRREADYILYTILLVLSFIQLNYLNINHVKYLLIAFLYLLLLYKNRNDKYKSSISLIVLVLSIINYFNGVITTFWLNTILNSLILILASIVLSYLVELREKDRNIFVIILIDLTMINLLQFRSSFSIMLYIFTIALIILIHGITNEQNKLSLISGIIFIFISASSLLFELASIPMFVYLLLMGILLMISVIYLINKQSKEDNVNYCSNCGTKLDKEDKYCNNCGEKIIR